MTTHLLEVGGIRKQFGSHRIGIQRRGGSVPAVADVSFYLDEGETLGIVGESGAGKSTLARLITRLIEPDSGRIRFAGIDVRALRSRELRTFRSQASIVFQNPYRSFNPRMLMSRALAEPLRAQGALPRREQKSRVAHAVETVGLSHDLLVRYPYELSGGQLQRMAIARALVTSPRLIVLDEPTSGLDVSVRASVINLLQDLQRDARVAFLLISHDVWVVGLMAQRIAVLKEGQIVETGPTDAVCADPAHPYTRELMASVPRLQKAWTRTASPAMLMHRFDTRNETAGGEAQ